MARKPKPEDPPPSKAYLVSFGDTMTTLLAFFIVLCSLAEEQSGANLYAGTGSFIKAMDGLGLPGPFKKESSAKVVEQDATNPLYVVEDLQDRAPEPNPTGPDEDNGLRSIDRENEVYQRFLNELNRLAHIEPLPETQGEVSFDLFNRIQPDPPHLTEPYREAFLRVLPTLRKPNYRIDVIVWATTPSPSAWNRAANQAMAIVDEVATSTGLDDERRARLRPLGMPWRYSDVKRPVLSIVVRKLDD